VKLAISNIAWPRGDDDRIAAAMANAGIGGLEIAPTSVWPDPLQASAEDRREFRARWEARGIRIVAFQALLFGHPEMVLFGEEHPRRAALEHLTGLMDLAAALGAGPMVFGSPRNRQAGALPPGAAREIAVRFFREAGRRAAERGVMLCLEPNPAAYGCDFINTAEEGRSLVLEVDSPGFRLHLDAGAMKMNGEYEPDAIRAAAPVLAHFHASEPHLAPLGTGGSNHAECARALALVAYSGWVSAEMRPPEGGGVERAIGLLPSLYSSTT